MGMNWQLSTHERIPSAKQYPPMPPKVKTNKNTQVPTESADDPKGSKARAAATRLKNKAAEQQASLKLQSETKGKFVLSSTLQIGLPDGRAVPRGAKTAALKNASELFCLIILWSINLTLNDQSG
jgi:hypothetical protein